MTVESHDPVVVVGAKRTAIGSFQGKLAPFSAPELGAAAIKGVLQQTNIDKSIIDQVLMGCVLAAGLGQAPARQAAVFAGIPFRTGCTTINKMCGSGMRSIMLACDSICAGSADIAIAGGMESMTNAPYLLPGAREGYRLGHQHVLDHMFVDGLEDAFEKGVVMGAFAERCAKKYHFSRQAQDEFAKTSILRAQDAAKKGLFATEIVSASLEAKTPQHLMDEGPQTHNVNNISNLKSAFMEQGTITAANSSSIADGAAALLVMKASKAKQLSLTPLAKIIGQATFSQAPEWFTTAPSGAITKLMQNITWKVEDVDLFEVNEAFAVVTMAAMQDLNIPHEKLNIFGGACVLGHPVGASGARILVTLLNALTQKGLSKGIASLCIGGGEATAMAIERLP